MIGFSIMIWFVSFVICIVAISLLRGNISGVHGKVFDETEDKIGYGKQLGKICLLICGGTFVSGIIGITVKNDIAILCAVAVLLFVMVIGFIWFGKVQKQYKI